MNKQRRADIARAAAMIDEARGIIEQACEDEREYLENMPEAIQDGEKGERADYVANTLEEVASDLTNAVDQLNEAAE